MTSRAGRRRSSVAHAFGLAAILLHAASVSAVDEPSKAFVRAGAPRLIVLVVADQGRYDYFENLRPYFRDGLARVLEGAARFENAEHDHAITNTCPGHAALVTGMYPSHARIVDNFWFDRTVGRRVYCVEDPTASVLPTGATQEGGEQAAAGPAGRSPTKLVVTGLPDWIKSADPRSKVFAVAGKDRAAIMLGGKRADAAFWYSYASGRFVTSRYYAGAYPPWVGAFHDEHDPARAFGAAWTRLSVSAEQARSFGLRPLPQQEEGFPHLLGGLTTTISPAFYEDFGESGLMTEHQMAFVTALVREEELGRDDSLDYLGIGVSELDLVGHRYGPNSAEVLDILLHLDAALGALLRELDKTVGRDAYVVALSADHGVMALPDASEVGAAAAELRWKPLDDDGAQGQVERLATADALCLQAVGRELDGALGKQRWLLWDLYLDYQSVARSGLRRGRVEQVIRRALEGCDAIARVWTRTELESGIPSPQHERGDTGYFERYVHSFDIERSPDALIQLEPNRLPKLGSGTTHGTPYRWDSHVPMAILAPGLERGAIPDPVATVDLAPTLAELLGIAAPEGLDGVSRLGLLRAAR